MESMEVVTSDEEMEQASQDKKTEDILEEATQTAVCTSDGTNSPIPSNELSTAEEVHEEMQVKLQIGPKSVHDLEADDTNSPTYKGDGEIVQRTFKSKDAIPSTSKVIVKRVKEPRIRELCILRPILPRKSKEKARQMMKVIAKGIIVPRGLIFQQKTRKRSGRLRRPNRTLQLVKKRKVSRNSLQTVWVRDRSGRHRSRSVDSFHSDHDCCCRCSNREFSWK